MPNILVIDDDPGICDLLKSFLEKEGYTVQIATTANEALDYIHIERPDLILMDVKMPDANGLELLPQIKAAINSYVIVITGLNDYRIADLLYEAGADGYLTKPLRLKTLSAAVHRLLDSQPTQLP